MAPYLMVMILIGLTWPFIGIGFMAINFEYFPTGSELLSQAFGLFMAGALSGSLLLVLQAAKETPYWKRWIRLSYLLFAPLCMMAALALFNPLGLESSGTALLVAPFALALVTNGALAAGMGSLAAIGVGIHRLATRIQPSPQPQPEEVRI
jgi:hypothetical protein